MSTQENVWSNELEPRQRAFLEAFSRTGTVVAASEGICNRVSHYRWSEESEIYRREFAVAKRLFGDMLLQVAVNRALEGAEETVRHKGVPVTDAQGNPVTKRRTDRFLLKHLLAVHERANPQTEGLQHNATL